MGKKRKESGHTVSTVVNPIYVLEGVDLEDAKHTSDLASRTGEEGGWMADLLNWEWATPVVGALTACVILLVIASVIKAIDDPKDSWRTQLPAGRSYEG